ncbi:MAG: response regulator [Vicinamibacteria bacterium]
MSVGESAVDILLVEDDPNDAELTLRALRTLDNPIKLVEDGEQALAFLFGDGGGGGLAAPAPKVVFLDLKLPKVDGLEVLRRIKQDARTRTIPVVVLTSSREESDIVESYHLGANSYIVKPVEFDQFMSAVSQLGRYWLLLNERPRK